MTDRHEAPETPLPPAAAGSSPPCPFRALDLLVYPSRNRIHRDGSELTVEPQAMKVLAYLASRAGEVVTKDELLDEVWGGIAISPNVLTYSVATARKALGDEWRRPRFIETISKGGYRWVAPVEPLDRRGGLLTSTERRTARARRGLGLLAPLMVGVAALAIGALAGRGGAPAYLRARPLTTMVGWEGAPALSRDGERVAFRHQGPDAPTTDLWLQEIGAVAPSRLTASPEVSETAPAFSPDGARIAYAALADGSCQILWQPITGDTARRIGHCATGPIGNLDFSPDGAWIAYDDRDTPATPRSIRLLEVATGRSREISFPAATDSGDRRPVFSPAGRRILFLRVRGDGLADLWIVAAAGGEPRRLTFDDRDVGGHDWTADGEAVVFSSYRAGQFSLWRVPAAGGTPSPIAIDDHQIAALRLARGADRMVYARSEYRASIWSVRGASEGSATRPASATTEPSRRAAIRFLTEPAPLIESTRLDLHPSLAPDGGRIAFVSDRSGHFELWSADPRGGELIRHTAFGGPFVSTPRWSPDAGSLVFDARPHGHADLFRVEARGDRPVRLTDAPSEEISASYSRDGRWIYFSSDREGGWDVWRMPATGGAARRVTRDGAYAALEGPDGKHLYYVRYGAPGLWSLDLASRQSRQVLEHPVIADWGNWTVANGGVYFLTRGTGAGLRFYDPLLDIDYPLAPIGSGVPYNHPSLAVSEDGTWLLAGVQTGRESDLMLVEGLR